MSSVGEPNCLAEQLPEEWSATLKSWQQPRYRSKQVFQWIHAQGVLEPGLMTNLPATLRERLAQEGLTSPVTVNTNLLSDDGTRKLVLELGKGERIETVLLPPTVRDRRDVSEADAVQETDTHIPVTQCVSSQVGCAMGCVFCASGIAGLKRHLSSAEIVAQVLTAQRYLKPGERIRRLVFMGMGEPLHNYDALVRALRLLTHPDGMALSPRRITVSTSGLVPQISKLGQEFAGKIQLAISLHATDDVTRSSILPVNRKYPLTKLLPALRAYPMPRRSRITVEYTLMKGINDTLEDAQRLAQMLKGIPVKINLIPMNPVPGSDLQAPEDDTIDMFQEELQKRWLSVFVRRQRGDDIAAACGQLALQTGPATSGRSAQSLPVVQAS